jgi:NAD(P)-dependent dehydrogenase (short-subunit alcohol dehydrogenase family)
MDDAVPFRQQVAVVTGSTQGIGLATARAFTTAGATVVVNGRDKARVDEVASELPGAVGIQGDLATEEGCARLVADALEACGRIDVLVNNAGRSYNALVTEMTIDQWRLNLDLNLTAPFLCSRLVGAAMMNQGSGAIVNIASIAAFTTPPQRAGYAAAKAGLLALTRVMATEFAPTVRVNAIAPGYVATEEWTRRVEAGIIDSETVARQTPLGRAGLPEEVADAVLYLASPRASFMTGTVQLIDGGFLASGKSF